MDIVIIKTLIIGLPISFLLGILGNLVVWKRMAFLGESIAHSALLGGALALMLNLPSTIILFFMCVFVSYLLMFLPSKNNISSDSILSIFSHSALALGVIFVVYLGQNVSVLMSVLFGDILAITWNDISMVFVLAIILSIGMYYLWNKVIIVIISEELAHTDGISVNKMKIMFAFILGASIGVLLKIMGSLLMTAMLVIPASTARLFAKTPLQMIVYAIIINISAFYLGLYCSYIVNLPCSPTIVVVALMLYLGSKLYKFFPLQH